MRPSIHIRPTLAIAAAGAVAMACDAPTDPELASPAVPQAEITASASAAAEQRLEASGYVGLVPGAAVPGDEVILPSELQQRIEANRPQDALLLDLPNLLGAGQTFIGKENVPQRMLDHIRERREANLRDLRRGSAGAMDMAPNLDMNRSASTDGEEPEFYAEPSSSWWYGGGSAVVPGWNNDWVDMFSWTESSEPVDYIDVIGSSVVEGWLRWAGIAAYEDYHQAVVGYIHDRTHDLANSFDQYGDHWLERHDLPGQQEFPMGVSCSPSFYCHNFLTWAHTYIWNWP